MRCSVAKCAQNNWNLDCKEVHYLTFPKNLKQRKLWASFCNRKSDISFETARICSLHFREEDFEEDMQFRLGFRKRKRVVLKAEAVPTIAVPTSPASMPMISSENDLCPEKSNLELNKEIMLLKGEIQALRKENNLLEENTRQLSQTNDSLQRQIESIRQINKNLEKSLGRFFTEGQIMKLRTGDRRKVWNANDIARSNTLYSASPKAYELLWRQKFPLPSIRTLQRWSQKSNIAKGVQKPVVKIVSKVKRKADIQ